MTKEDTIVAELPFGGCPDCGKCSQITLYTLPLGVCHEHQVYWSIGPALGDRLIDPLDDDWARNDMVIHDYLEVDPIYRIYHVETPA